MAYLGVFGTILGEAVLVSRVVGGVLALAGVTLTNRAR